MPQDETKATYFPRLNTPSQAWIDWSWPGDEIEPFVRAFSYPYEGVRTIVNDKIVNLFDCVFEKREVHPHSFFNGIVFRIHGARHHVACNGGTLIIDEQHVITEKPLKLGDRFFTPRHVLDDALAFRPVYTPSGLKNA